MTTLDNIIHTISKNMKCSYVGDKSIEITKPIKLDINNVDSSAIFWCNSKNLHKLNELKEGIILLSHKDSEIALLDSFNGIIIRCDDPRRAFSLILEAYFAIDNTPQYRIGVESDIIVGTGTIIEEDVSIGKNVIIGYNNVIARGTIIGNNVTIGHNNTIGSVGFGYTKDDDGNNVLIQHVGNVMIEDNVEIGSNNCIDRAVLGSTVLKTNCKIDNLTHIAHGSVIGENSLIIANAVICGSAEVGKNTWIAPSTILINGKKIGDNCMSGLGAVITKDVEDNSLVVGIPAKKVKDLK